MLCLLYGPTLTTIHDHWKDHSLDYMDLCQQCFCFSTHGLGLSSFSFQEAFIFWFHGCSHHPQWFWRPGRGNLWLLPTFPFYLPCIMGLAAIILVFLIFSLKPALSLCFFTLIRRFFGSSLLSAVTVITSAYPRLCMIFPPILILACNSPSAHFAWCAQCID